jgi:NADH-quinone oxidoreductase subunit J
MDGAGIIIAFWLLAGLTVCSALGIAGARNLIHAVVFLILTLMGLAGLYITLSADFIAIVQILVYVGAISVLFLFAIVLTPRAERKNQDGFLALPALGLCTLVSALLIFVALDTDWNTPDHLGFEETATTIGALLLDRYVLAFEIASVLLLVAVIGSIVLVRPEPLDESVEGD